MCLQEHFQKERLSLGMQMIPLGLLHQSYSKTRGIEERSNSEPRKSIKLLMEDKEQCK